MDSQSAVSGQGGQRLPALRQDLDLYPGPRNQDGSPTWTLHDPVRNLFFRIGWLEFEILSRWRVGDADALLERLESETTLLADTSHVDALARFLVLNQLVEARGREAIKGFCERAEAGKQRLSSWLLHNYLFFRVPLVRPQAFLDRTYPYIRFVYTRGFAYLVLLALAVGIFLVSRQWESFLFGFSYLFTWQGLVLLAVSIVLAKVVHELGHAYTAIRYGVKVPSMGVAFLVLWPVLYTDTTEAWKLASRRQRMAIAMAGMGAELVLAVFATLAWSFLPDGELRSVVFIVATTTWVITLLINANPLMRFDGYYLLSDAFDIQNLQDRSFTLGKWRLRNLLFGFNDPSPERLPGRTQNFMIAYAYLTWVYRLFLFVAIALVVYALFFKVAGIILLLVELAWFVGRPIYREVKEWLGRRDQVRWNRNTGVTLVLLAGGLLLLVVPWKVQLSLPALMQAPEQASLHAPVASRIAGIHVAEGDRVSEGQVLFTLESPENAHQIEVTQQRVNMLRQRLARRQANERFLEESLILQERLVQAVTELEGYRLEQAQLRVTAPIAGRIADLGSDLRPGRWINEKLLLSRVVSDASPMVKAYLDETGLARVTVGAKGRFYPDNPDLDPQPVSVTHISDVNVRELDDLYLASVYGGPIGVRSGANGELLTVDSLYRVSLESPRQQMSLTHPQKGTVRLAADAQSLLYRLWLQTGMLLVRESGF